MQYDIFISYASEDVAWARKLDGALQAGGRKTFRDEERLKVGREWEPQLKDALDGSQHLVVLWSANAKRSDWVHKEMGRFERNAETDRRRRFICINLEGRNVAYTTYQNIDVNFTGDPSALDSNVWGKVLERLRTAIDEDEDVERIETVVLAMTDDEANPATTGGLSHQDLDTIQKDFGLAEKDVTGRYRPGRLDWCPYGGPLSISRLLDALIDTVNRAVASVVPVTRFAWKAVPDDFWSSNDRAQELAAGLANAKLSLVVIDALSLKWHAIYQRLMFLREHLRGSSSTWIFVPPLPSDPTMIRYRDLVRKWSAPLLDTYFRPPVPRRDQLLPQFGVFCGDDAEIGRLLLASIGEYLARNDRTPRSPFTDYRGPGH